MNPFSKFTFEKREEVSPIGRTLAIVIALIAAMLISAILIKLANASPMEAFINLIKGAFGNKRAVLETLVKSTPLILTGLATVIAFRGKIWSIGQEGSSSWEPLVGIGLTAYLKDYPRLHLYPLLSWVGF